jgi:hypothetical protein
VSARSHIFELLTIMALELGAPKGSAIMLRYNLIFLLGSLFAPTTQGAIRFRAAFDRLDGELSESIPHQFGKRT